MGSSRDVDHDLVRAFVGQRSVSAFRELYDRYRDKVYATAFQITGDGNEALDVAQEVFLRVFGKIDRFRFESSFSSWLYRLTVNLATDFRRKRKVRRMAPLEVRDSDGEVRECPVADGNDGPERRAVAHELSDGVMAALQSLSPKLRAVVVLRYLQGLSYEEVGEVIGTPVGTVKSRLNRAHEKLKPLLEHMSGPA